MQSASRVMGRGRRSNRPSPRELNNHVVEAAAVKWKGLGFQLLNNETAQHILENIEADHKGEDVKKCCQQMFTKWLDTQVIASWDELLEALRSPSIQLMHLANEIEQMLDNENDNHDSTSECPSDQTEEQASESKSDDNHDSVTFHEQVNELTTVEDVEVEFASTTDKIKQERQNKWVKANTDKSDMTEDESAAKKIAMENWLTSDSRIIMLMAAIIIAILFNFFFSIGWIRFVEGNIFIVPVIIGLIIQPNLYFKGSVLKLGTATSPIVKRMGLSNVTTANSVVQRMAMTIIGLTVKMYFTSVAIIIMLIVDKPKLSNLILFASIRTFDYFDLSYDPLDAVYSSFVILTAPSMHIKFNRLARLIFVIVSGALCCVFIILNGVKISLDIITFTFIFTLMFCFSLLHDSHSHEIVYFAVCLCITIFTHDLVLSLVEIPDVVTRRLHFLSIQVSLVYLVSYNILDIYVDLTS